MTFRFNQLSSLLKLIATALLLSITGTSQALAKDTYYQWVGENNVTHYSEIPPESTDAIKGKISNKPSSSHGAEQQRLDQYRVQRDKALDEQSEIASTTKTNQEQSAVLKEQCKRARDNIATINQGGRIREQSGDNGELRYLSEAEKQDQREKAANYIKEYCS